jgi:putative addiction module killer protein
LRHRQAAKPGPHFILALRRPAVAGRLDLRYGVGVGVGYRVYFSRRAEVVNLLLVGGDKSSQKRDIKRAIDMARALDKD